MICVAICAVCKTEFSRRQAASKPFPKYCSTECAGKGRRGTGKGRYVHRGSQYEHRVVMEQMLGRPLQSHEHVHHGDENTRNNDPANLEVLTNTEHQSRHFVVPDETIARIRTLYATGQYMQIEVAAMVGLSKNYVSTIIRGTRRRYAGRHAK